jgi:hypothetical protein
MFEPLGVERHADAVMPKNLNGAAFTSAEDEQVAGVRIAAEPLLSLERQPVRHQARSKSSARHPPSAYFADDSDRSLSK